MELQSENLVVEGWRCPLPAHHHKIQYNVSDDGTHSRGGKAQASFVVMKTQ